MSIMTATADAMLAVQLSRGVWIGVVLLIFIAVLVVAFAGIWWYMDHRNHQADPAETEPQHRAADAFQEMYRDEASASTASDTHHGERRNGG